MYVTKQLNTNSQKGNLNLNRSEKLNLSSSEIFKLEILIYFSLIFISGETNLFGTIIQSVPFFITFKSGIM